MTPTRDSTIAARVPLDLRQDLEHVSTKLDGDPELSVTIRRALRLYTEARKRGVEVSSLLAQPPAPPAPAVGALVPLSGIRPQARARGPETARTAARHAWPKSASVLRAVLEAVHRAGDDGRTADELAVELGLEDTYHAPRRLSDLKRGGWVIVRTERGPEGQDVPVRRPTRTGVLADVYVLSHAARGRLAQDLAA